MTEVIVIAAATFLVVLAVNGLYNWLIELWRRCDQAVADVDVQLRQRKASGSEIRQKMYQGESPSVAAASSSLGSTFENATNADMMATGDET